MRKHLIVGLGNPGREFEGTRHNIGFRVVEKLWEELHDLEGEDGLAPAGNTLTGWARYQDAEVGLAKPLTYVNRSGEAVKRLLQLHEIELDRLLIVVDDLHLPVGSVRLRGGGSSGGHNGLDNIAQCLGTDQYPRLRLGIGSNFSDGGMVNYVLSPFTAEEQSHINQAVEHACASALAFVAEGLETAMNRFNWW